MRRFALLAVVLLPLAAAADDVMTQPAEWTKCAADADCAVVKGACGPEAVHVGYQTDAETFFREKAQTMKCVPKFWEPAQKDAVAHCHMERCEIIGKE